MVPALKLLSWLRLSRVVVFCSKINPRVPKRDDQKLARGFNSGSATKTVKILDQGLFSFFAFFALLTSNFVQFRADFFARRSLSKAELRIWILFSACLRVLCVQLIPFGWLWSSCLWLRLCRAAIFCSKSSVRN